MSKPYEELEYELRKLQQHAFDKVVNSDGQDRLQSYWQGKKDGLRVAITLLLAYNGDKERAERLKIRAESASSGMGEDFPDKVFNEFLEQKK